MQAKEIVWPSLAIVLLCTCSAVAQDEYAGLIIVPAQWNCSIPGFNPDMGNPTMEWNYTSIWFLTPDQRECECNSVLSVDSATVERLIRYEDQNATIETLNPGPDGMFNITPYGARRDTLKEMVKAPEFRNKAIGYYLDNEGDKWNFILTYEFVNETHVLVQIQDEFQEAQSMNKVVVFEP